MKRSHEKIKDIVDAQPYDQVQNYPADLRRALGAYRFTDVTSILVADWLDTLANLPKNRGASPSSGRCQRCGEKSYPGRVCCTGRLP